MLKKIVLSISIGLVLFFAKSNFVSAASCANFSISPGVVNIGESFIVNKSDGLIANEYAQASIQGTTTQQEIDCQADPSLCSGNPTQLFTFSSTGLMPNTSYNVSVFYLDALGDSVTCSLSVSVIGNQQNLCSNPGLESINDSSGIETTNFTFTGCLGGGTDPNNPCNGESRIVVTDANSGELMREIDVAGSSCSSDGTFAQGVGNFNVGVFNARLYIGTSPAGPVINFTVDTADSPLEGDDCTVASGGNLCRGATVITNGVPVCTYDPSNCFSCSSCTPATCSDTDEVKCNSFSAKLFQCTSPQTGKSGVDTAIGCVPYSLIEDTTSFFLKWAIAFGGGIAILFIIYASFLIITSSGDPDKISMGRDMLTSAITGILMVIFSVFLFRIIGVNILQIF